MHKIFFPRLNRAPLSHRLCLVVRLCVCVSALSRSDELALECSEVGRQRTHAAVRRGTRRPASIPLAARVRLFELVVSRWYSRAMHDARGSHLALPVVAPRSCRTPCRWREGARRVRAHDGHIQDLCYGRGWADDLTTQPTKIADAHGSRLFPPPPVCLAADARE